MGIFFIMQFKVWLADNRSSKGNLGWELGCYSSIYTKSVYLLYTGLDLLHVIRTLCTYFHIKYFWDILLLIHHFTCFNHFHKHPNWSHKMKLLNLRRDRVSLFWYVNNPNQIPLQSWLVCLKDSEASKVSLSYLK